MAQPSGSPETTPTSTPPGAPGARRPGGALQRMQKGTIQRVVAVGSGKGGVGKSTATALLAVGLARRGLKVGILDADVTGPSMPKLFGVTGPLLDRGEGIEPARTEGGIPIVSSQFLVEDEQTPVIWRGPLVTRLIIQFFGGVNWGPLDYLLIDMPPGTSDVPLTVFQTIPIDGMLFVFTPQDLAALIVKKAMNMARDLHVPLLGVVENMAYLDCPHCQNRIDLFGPSRVAGVAEEYGIPIGGQLPVEPAISTLGDAGTIARYDGKTLDSYTTGFLAAMDEATKGKLTVL